MQKNEMWINTLFKGVSRINYYIYLYIFFAIYTNYLPIQNLLKMVSNKSSLVICPVMSPK